MDLCIQGWVNSLVVMRFFNDGEADLVVVYEQIRPALVSHSSKGLYLVNLVE